MPNTPVTLVPGTLPYDCYPALPQTLNIDIVTRIVASISEAFPGIVVGNTEPDPQYRDRVWFNTISTRWYYYINGMWQRVYDVAASSSERRLWVGLETDLDTYDGGSSGAVGSSTGPLWEVDHNFDGRFPIAPGLVPTYTPPLTVAVGDTGGEGQHSLTADENGPHTHVTKLPRDGAAPDMLESTAIATHDQTVTLPWTSESSGLGTAHNNLPPYRGVFLIKRTARVYVQPPY